MRVFLLGFMGVGKSTLGTKVAERLHLPFVDLDEWIEDKTSKTVSEIFQDYGEPLFRKLESENLTEIIRRYERFIMATGGGLPCHGNNLELMQNNGLTIYLRASSDQLADRLIASKGKRPLISDKSRQEQQVYIDELLIKREKIYSQAVEILELDLKRSKEENTVVLEKLISSHLTRSDQD